jgi:hypothetical protein
MLPYNCFGVNLEAGNAYQHETGVTKTRDLGSSLPLKPI